MIRARLSNSYFILNLKTVLSAIISAATTAGAAAAMPL